MDVTFGTLVAAAISRWRGGHGTGQAVLWPPFALLWLSIMPLSMLANCDA
jgi:hypothetical protein